MHMIAAKAVALRIAQRAVQRAAAADDRKRAGAGEGLEQAGWRS